MFYVVHICNAEFVLFCRLIDSSNVLHVLNSILSICRASSSRNSFVQVLEGNVLAELSSLCKSTSEQNALLELFEVHFHVFQVYFHIHVTPSAFLPLWETCEWLSLHEWLMCAAAVPSRRTLSIIIGLHRILPFWEIILSFWTRFWHTKPSSIPWR